LWMCTASLHSVRGRRYVGRLAIPMSVSLSGGEPLCGACGQPSRWIYDRKLRQVRDLSAADTRIYLEIESRRVRCGSCGKVKQEKLAWLSNNPFYTQALRVF
jgi:transposase